MWATWSIWAMTAVQAGAAPLPAHLLDLGSHTQAEVRTLTQAVEAAGGWWLEFETQLLVAAPAPALQRLTQNRAGTPLPALTPEALALQARACGVDERQHLPAIAEAGRFALVWAPRRFVPYATAPSSEWQPVLPNTVLGRDQSHRGDPQPKGGADPQILARVQAVDPHRWFSALSDLAGFDRSSFGNSIDGARDWLAARFTEAGLQVSLHTFSFNHSSTMVSVENVVATLPGTDLAHEWIIVGGHYDSRNLVITSTTQTPGAEDNASGCAGVLEMARVFAQVERRRTMVFACFAGEEQGLFGGHAFAQKLLNDGDLARVQLAVIMDMIGYSGDTDLDLLLETGSAHTGLFARYTAARPLYAPEARIVTSSTPCCSDHMPFIDRGVPALLTIQNDWNPGQPGGYVHYHTITDIPANITRATEMGGAILKLNAAILAEAVGLVPVLFKDGFE